MTVATLPPAATAANFASLLLACASEAHRAGQHVTTAHNHVPAGSVRCEGARLSSDRPAGVSQAPAGAGGGVDGGGRSVSMTSSVGPKPQNEGGSHETFTFGR